MTEEPQPALDSDWQPLPRRGCVNVDSRRLLVRDGLALALLRFQPAGTIDEHAAPHDVDVVCLDGEGYISVEDRVNTFAAGQWLTWPAGQVHRLWTAERGMVTLMVERLRP
jgi:quercetin dioxygenase-like cupin family protein